MLGNYEIHTDLALEERERVEADDVEVQGVSLEEVYLEEKEIRITTVKILTENGAKVMGKPVGTYITMEADNLTVPDEEYQEEIAKELAHHLTETLKLEQKDDTILVVGLGNRNVTPDALGPHVIDALRVNRHVIMEYGKYAMAKEHVHMVSAISPGVMAQTGMETLEILKGIVSEVKPDAVVIIDALAARNTRRLNRTIQIADTGINPGSGVGNHRQGINEESLGIPVIAIGVPTVVDAATIVRDTMEKLMDGMDAEEKQSAMEQLIAPHLHGMFVTPKDIDDTVCRIGDTISMALNLVFE